MSQNTLFNRVANLVKTIDDRQKVAKAAKPDMVYGTFNGTRFQPVFFTHNGEDLLSEDELKTLNVVFEVASHPQDREEAYKILVDLLKEKEQELAEGDTPVPGSHAAYVYVARRRLEGMMASKKLHLPRMTFFQRKEGVTSKIQA